MPRRIPKAQRSVKKAISLPASLARMAEDLAKQQDQTLSALVQDALREYQRGRLKQEYRDIQGFWSRQARTKGILTERDLERLLEQ